MKGQTDGGRKGGTDWPVYWPTNQSTDYITSSHPFILLFIDYRIVGGGVSPTQHRGEGRKTPRTRPQDTTTHTHTLFTDCSSFNCLSLNCGREVKNLQQSPPYLWVMFQDPPQKLCLTVTNPQTPYITGFLYMRKFHTDIANIKYSNIKLHCTLLYSTVQYCTLSLSRMKGSWCLSLILNRQ